MNGKSLQLTFVPWTCFDGKTKFSMIGSWFWWNYNLCGGFCNLFQTLMICLTMCVNVFSCDFRLCLCFYFVFCYSSFLSSSLSLCFLGLRFSLDNLLREKSFLPSILIEPSVLRRKVMYLIWLQPSQQFKDERMI